ncbi:putative DNA-binding transcriptional regulator [compost metagenome]
MVLAMKPTEHIAKLINSVSDGTRIQNSRERQIISLQQYAEPMCFILHKGTAAIYRGYDHLLLSHIKAPHVMGLNLLFQKNSELYFQARSSVAYEIVPRSKFEEQIRAQNLWESLAYYFMFSSKRFLHNNFTSCGVSTYELVRNNLIALMNESEELRLATNTCDYIQEKTLLSRSGIMKMLSDLKHGEHIELQRGVLLTIHNLPAKY